MPTETIDSNNSDSSSQRTALHLMYSPDQSMEVNYVENDMDAERAWPSHRPLASLSF